MKSNTGLIKSEQDLPLIRRSGYIAARALKKILANVKPGILLSELDKIGEDEILSLGGQPAFLTVPGYHWTTCLSVNDQVVHGIPRDLPLQQGDILSVDIGAVYQGWYTDMAWSVLVGEDTYQGADKKAKEKFLRTGKEALWHSIRQARSGNRIGDISAAIQTTIEGAGYSVVKSLSGHGVGRSYHEEPEVPEYGRKGTGLMLADNMVLAIEPIYAAGSGKVYEESDGWTISTVDQSWGGMFEMTVIVGTKPEIITDWRNV